MGRDIRTSVDPADSRELVELDHTECLALLRLERLGRLAVAADGPGAPDVVPVNFVLEGERPIVRSHDGRFLDRVIGSRVSLQVDRFDWFHRAGWSVLVQGHAEFVDASDEVSDELDCWAPGPQPRFVRIEPERITGRRIELHQAPLDGRAYL